MPTSNLPNIQACLAVIGAGMLLGFSPGAFAQSNPEVLGSAPASASASAFAPTTFSALRQQGFDAVARGDYSAAEAALTQARKLAPDDAFVLLNLGSVYAKECRTDEAVALFKEVAARDRADANATDLPAGVAIGGASKDINDGMLGKSPAYIARYNLTRLKPCAS